MFTISSDRSFFICPHFPRIFCLLYILFFWQKIFVEWSIEQVISKHVLLFLKGSLNLGYLLCLGFTIYWQGLCVTGGLILCPVESYHTWKIRVTHSSVTRNFFRWTLEISLLVRCHICTIWCPKLFNSRQDSFLWRYSIEKPTKICCFIFLLQAKKRCCVLFFRCIWRCYDFCDRWARQKNRIKRWCLFISRGVIIERDVDVWRHQAFAYVYVDCYSY